ncbi:hypothetical protein ACXJJ3_36945 [Kribbella sp. WER1]
MTPTLEAAGAEPQTSDHQPIASPGPLDDGANPDAKATTEINNSSGPVHAGSGSQLNDIKYLFNRPREARTTAVSPVELRKLRSYFVPPPNFSRAAEVLAQPEGLVILNGVPDSGRRTAGLMLLSDGIPPDSTVRFIPPELELHATQAERRMFAGKDVRDGDRLLLDLSEVDADSFREQQACIHDLQAALLACKAKLVAILPHLPGEQLQPDFVPYRVDIGRPAMSTVLQRQLSTHGIRVRSSFRQDKAFASATMSALVQVVYQVRDAYLEHPDTDADVLLGEVLDSGERRAEGARKAYQSTKDQHARALLIAVALLHGQSTRAIFVAQHRLLELLRTADDDRTHPLDLSGVEKSLAELAVELSVTSDQRIAFADQAVATEVLRCFWDEMPWLRDPLGEWLGELAGAGIVDRFELSEIAQRFGEHCRRTRQADLALHLVEQWSSDRQSPVRLAAYALLADLLVDDQTDSLARQTLYAWARDLNLSGGRAAIVIAACVNILAHGYLDQAVVRLSWLTKHSEREVHYAARDGLTRLAEDPATRLQVIDMLLEPWRFAPANFAAAAAPMGMLLFVGDEAAERVVEGWQRAVSETEPHRREFLLRPWLEAHEECLAQEREQDANRLLQMLAAICGRQRELLDAAADSMLSWLNMRSDDPVRQRTARAVSELVKRERRSSGSTRPTGLEAGA